MRSTIAPDLRGGGGEVEAVARATGGRGLRRAVLGMLLLSTGCETESAGPLGSDANEALPAAPDVTLGDPQDGVGGARSPEQPECGSEWAPLTAHEVHGEVQPRHLADLQLVIGRFVERSVPLYTGTLEASDTRGNWDPATGNGSVVSRSALAWIEPSTWPSPGHVLIIADRATGAGVDLRQLDDAPGTTAGSLVVDCHPSTGFPSTCQGCVTPLAEEPDELELGPVVMGGTWPSGGQPADLTLRASLVALPPGPLAPDDVRLILEGSCPAAFGFAHFDLVGDSELVVPVHGELSLPVDAPDCYATCSNPLPEPHASPSQYGSCYLQVPYSAELFLHVDAPHDRGLRAVTLGEQSVHCSYADPCGGAAMFSAAFPVE